MKNFEIVNSLVKREIFKQDMKWDENRIQHPFLWNTILMEEVGEFSEAILHDEFGGRSAGTALEEAIQIAAVAMQIANDLLIQDYNGSLKSWIEMVDNNE